MIICMTCRAALDPDAPGRPCPTCHPVKVTRELSGLECAALEAARRAGRLGRELDRTLEEHAKLRRMGLLS